MGRSTTTIHISIVDVYMGVCVCIYKIRKIFALNLKAKALYCLDRAGALYRHSYLYIYIWKGLGLSAFPLQETLKNNNIRWKCEQRRRRHVIIIQSTLQTRQPGSRTGAGSKEPHRHQSTNRPTQHKNNKKKKYKKTS